jgi:transcriptional regulator with XRE-family HTH domain
MLGKDHTSQAIRQKRVELGLSLRELASRTNLTASFLSQVENGKANLSLDSLRRISVALNVSMLALFPDQNADRDDSKAEEISEDKIGFNRNIYAPVVRNDARVKLTLPGHGITYQLLTQDLNRKMEAILGFLEPGSGNIARRLREPTEEFIFVLSGKLLVELDSGKYILAASDSIYLNGLSLNRLECASKDEPVQWISVFTPSVF